MLKTLNYTSFIVILFLNFRVLAQVNLVPNPSFETFTRCPDRSSTVDTSETIFPYVQSWFRVTGGTPDYFNGCDTGRVDVPSNFATTIEAHGGVAYSGFFVYVGSNSTEYISCKLLTNTIPMSRYVITFFVNLAKFPGPTQEGIGIAATDKLTIGFSKNRPSFRNNSGIIIDSAFYKVDFFNQTFFKDTASWMKCEQIIQFPSEYNYITIGQFDSNTNKLVIRKPRLNAINPFIYYLLDDVSITLLDTIGITKDTTVCLGKTVSFTKRANWDSCRWFDGTTDSLKTFAVTGVYWVTNYYQGLQVTDTFKVNIIDTAQSIITQTGFCAGNSAILQARASSTYLWNTGSTNPQLETTTAGLYTVLLSNQECLVTDTFYVTQYALPVITGLTDTVVCFDQVAQILLDAGQFKSYLWKPTGETTRTIYSNTAQVYLLTVTDTNNCSSSKQVAVMETCPDELFIPNAFTPNGDGINDVWKIASLSVTQFELSIYNRWGELLFHTTNKTQYWDGNNAPADAYTYVINYKATGKPIQSKKGTVTLVR